MYTPGYTPQGNYSGASPYSAPAPPTPAAKQAMAKQAAEEDAKQIGSVEEHSYDRFYNRQTRFGHWEAVICFIYTLLFTGVLYLVSKIPCDEDLKKEFMGNPTIRLAQFLPAIAFGTVATDIWFHHIQEFNSFKRSLAWVMVTIHLMSCIVEIFAFTGNVPVFRDAFGRVFVPHHYLGWMHTTPIMVYVLSHVSIRPNKTVFGTMLRLACIFPCGMASISRIPAMIRMLTGMVAYSLFASVMIDLLAMYNEVSVVMADRVSKSVRTNIVAERLVRAVGFQIKFIIVTWTAFPVIWTASNAGLLTSERQEILLSIMNFLSKVLFANSALATVCMQLDTELNVKSITDVEHIFQQEAFLQSVGHEMRAPLDGIIGLSDTLSQVGSMTEKQRKFMTLIKNAGMQLLGIIDDILDVRASKKGDLALVAETLDIAEIVNHVVAVLTPLKRFDVNLRAEIQGYLPPIQGDKGRIIQVFTNLVGNALKFTHKGYVKLSATFDSYEKMMVVQVTDTGIGIPSNKINQLFQEFVQIDSHITRNYGGTGLGLSISKQLVEAHGGTITVQSSEGRGSVFSVRLPLIAKFVAANNNLKFRPGRQVEDAPASMHSPRMMQQPQQQFSPRTPEPVVSPHMGGGAYQGMHMHRQDVGGYGSRPQDSYGMAIGSDLYSNEPVRNNMPSDEVPGFETINKANFFSPQMEPAFAGQGRGGKAVPYDEEPAAPPPSFLQSRNDIQRVVESEIGFTSGSVRKRTLSSKAGNASGSGSRGVASAGAKQTFFRFANEGKIKALSTDDDPVNQMVIEEILETSGFEVETARSGEECLRRLQTAPYLPDVLLLDVMMPGMSGLEVLEKIRESPSLRELPVVLCSALDSANFMREAQRLGCNGFVTKPINRTALMNTLQRCIPLPAGAL